ncbi:MAG: DUF1501 domain-containing protein [Bryobacteraceae bacterium]
MHKFDRRGFLRAGSIAAFGVLPWGEVLRLRAQNPEKPKKEISVIHIFLAGGMSQLDTFDMKLEANPKHRTVFKPIPTKVDGLQICEHLPLTAKQAGKFLLIRSMTHKVSAHGAARTLMMTGHEFLPTIQHPSIGSVVTKELGPRNELPAYVAIPAGEGPYSRGGFLGPQYNPFNAGEVNVEKYAVRDLNLPMGVDWSRMEGRYSLLSLVDSKIRKWDTGDTFESLDSYYKSAFELMRSPRAKKAFDVSQEPEKLRDRYGRTTTGQGCLLARRLVEAGVRFITLGRGGNAWDHHGNIFPNLANDFLPELDKAYSTLLEDLAERGLLDTTLVLVTGEFGRTPEINVNGGRDHWPNCFSLTVAGAGIQGGRVWGASDADGMFVKDSPVEVSDFVATLYHKFGIDYTKEYVSNIGRPIKLANDGKPLPFMV